ncbi:MAG: STAS domain-containing protein [Solirubrobacteraceae bacterium]
MTSGDARDIPRPFRTELEPHQETILVVAEGELDMASSGKLGGELRELLGAGFARIVLDLRGVSFLDSSGLKTILDAHAASRTASVEFAVIQGPAPVRRIFELTGTEVALQFVAPSAIDGIGGRPR